MSAPRQSCEFAQASGARRRTRRTSRDRTPGGAARVEPAEAVRCAAPAPRGARAFMMCTVRETILFANAPRGIRAAPVCVFSTSQNIPIPEPIRAKRIRSRVVLAPPDQRARPVSDATSAQPARHPLSGHRRCRKPRPALRDLRRARLRPRGDIRPYVHAPFPSRAHRPPAACPLISRIR